LSNYDTINDRLSTIIDEKTKLSKDDIRPDLNLESSGLDSFARIELILVIEEEFGIELSDSESADIATVDDIIKMIEQKTESV